MGRRFGVAAVRAKEAICGATPDQAVGSALLRPDMPRVATHQSRMLVHMAISYSSVLTKLPSTALSSLSTRIHGYGRSSLDSTSSTTPTGSYLMYAAQSPMHQIRNLPAQSLTRGPSCSRGNSLACIQLPSLSRMVWRDVPSL